MIEIIALSLFASLALVVGDLGHVHSGMATYPGDQGIRFFQIPLWVFGEFFLAALSLIFFYPLKVKLLNLNDSSIKLKEVMFSFGITILIYLMTSLPEAIYLLKLIILITLFGLQLYRYKMYDIKSILDLVAIAFGGCAFEYFLGTQNIFVYLPHPSVFHSLPIWLPLIYLSAGISARLCGRYFYK